MILKGLRQAFDDGRRLQKAKEFAKEALKISKMEGVSHRDAIALLAGTLIIVENMPKKCFFAKMCKRFRDAYRDAKHRKRVNRMAFESVERREERRQKKKRKIEKLQKEMREI